MLWLIPEATIQYAGVVRMPLFMDVHENLPVLRRSRRRALDLVRRVVEDAVLQQRVDLVGDGAARPRSQADG